MNEYVKFIFKNYKKNMIKNVVANLIVMGLSIASPIILRECVNNYEGFSEVKIWILYFTTFIASYLVMIYAKIYDLRVAKKFKVKESCRILNWIFDMDYSELIRLEPTYLVDKLAGTVDTIYLMYSQAVSGFFVSGITIFITLLLIMKADIWLFVLFILLIPTFKIGPYKLNQELAKRSQHMQGTIAKNNMFIKGLLSNPEYVKQMDDREGLLHEAKEGFNRVQEEKYSVNRYAQIFSVGIDFFMVLLQNLITIYTIFLYVTQKIGVSDIVFINLVSGIYINALSRVINLDIAMRDLKGALNYVDKEILTYIEEDGTTDINEVSDIEISIREFGYDKTLIESAFCKFKRGEQIGIFGKSGSGKSTILKTLLKLVKSNDVKINGIPISDITNKSLRKRITYVSQDTYIFPGSILDNITLYHNYSEEEIKGILGRDVLHKFLQLPEGINTNVMENGANLSGGDKQRIMLARLFLDKPDVIILDETFSSLDEKTAVELEKDIFTYFSDKIVIVVAHNPRLLESCNRKLELRDGVLQEC